LHVAPRTILRNQENSFPVFETLGEIGVEFGCYLAVPALRLDDAADGDKLFAYSRISRV
jgi:hypothetical protein